MPYGDEIKLTRQELFDMVWSESLVKLSAKLGISDNGIRKACKRYNIPLPVRGYWARKRRPSNRPPLPSMKSDTVEIQKIAPRYAPEIREALNEKIAEINKPDDKHILVETTLQDPHPLVIKTQKAFLKAKVDDMGLLNPRARCLDTRVSTGSVDRALRIMDALVKALNDRKLKVKIASEGKAMTYITADDESIEFYLKESVERTERGLTPAEKKEALKYPWMYDRKLYSYNPTGLLSLSIKTEYYRSYGTRLTWSDGKKQRIEDCLDKFVAGVLKFAAILKAEKLERVRREQEHLESMRIRQEKLRLQQEEQKRVDTLMSESSSWNKSRELRMYIAAVKAAA